MAEESDPSQLQLLEQAGKLLLSGQFGTALPMLEEGAQRLLAAGDRPREAALAFLSIARLKTVLGNAAAARQAIDTAEPLARQGGIYSDWLRARAELVEAEGGSGAAEAWRQALAEASPRAQPFILSRLAELAKAAGDPQAAAALYTKMLGVGDPPPKSVDRAELLIERAICRQAGGDRAAAVADLEEAESLLGPKDGAARSRLLGQRALLALERGETEAALALALSAREAAVSASDVLAYLPCVSLISSIHLRRGQEVEAYEALVRARVSVKDILGPTGEQLVAPLIQTFAQSVGPRFEEIRSRYIAARRAAQKGQ